MKINKKAVLISLAAASLVIAAVFLAFQINRQIKPNIKYCLINDGALTESVEIDGAVFRNETVITSTAEGVSLTRENGEKIAAGAVVARGADGITEITSPVSGFFYANVDGREDAFTPDAAADLTPSKLTELLSAKAEKPENAVGKTATDFIWLLAANTSYDGFRAGVIYSARIGEFDVQMSAVRVSSEENGVRTAVFDCGGAHSAISAREVKAVVSVAHTGKIVPTEALRGKAGEKYIFVFEKGKSIKIDVDVIYDGGEYAVVLSKTDISGKAAIIGGSLYDGKVLK